MPPRNNPRMPPFAPVPKQPDHIALEHRVLARWEAERTFETLRDRFGVRDDGVEHLARLVHDLDLKDGRYEAPAAATLGPLIEGLRLAESDDAVLLAHGMVLFEALYRSVARPSPLERLAINETVAPSLAGGE